MHELKIMVNPFNSEEKSYELKRSSYKANVEYIRKEQGTAENIVTIEKIIIPAESEVVISFGISKYLREWETYPNDPSRGFNIMQMPVFYRVHISKEERNWFWLDAQNESIQLQKWRKIESAPLLV